MAGINAEIRFSEYRPCVVNGKKALFHRFADMARTVGESPLRGGHSAGQLWEIVAVVEYENGDVDLTKPWNVKFLDSDCYFSRMSFGREDNAAD